MEALLCHLVGDYLLQTHAMAVGKVRSTAWAAVHGAAYSVPFLLLHPSLLAWLVILLTHIAIDRTRFVRRLCRRKNGVATDTGFPSGTPDHIVFFVTVLVDNTLHLLINAAALGWL